MSSFRIRLGDQIKIISSSIESFLIIYVELSYVPHWVNCRLCYPFISIHCFIIKFPTAKNKKPRFLTIQINYLQCRYSFWILFVYKCVDTAFCDSGFSILEDTGCFSYECKSFQYLKISSKKCKYTSIES